MAAAADDDDSMTAIRARDVLFRRQSGACWVDGLPACPGGHTLTGFVTPVPGFGCDVCGVELKEPGMEMRGCRICNFDVCNACNAKAPPVSRRTRKQVAEKAAALEAVAVDPSALRHAPPFLRADREVVLAAIKADAALVSKRACGSGGGGGGGGHYLSAEPFQYASDALRADADFVSAAMVVAYDACSPETDRWILLELHNPGDEDRVRAMLGLNLCVYRHASAALRGGWLLAMCAILQFYEVLELIFNEEIAHTGPFLDSLLQAQREVLGADELLGADDDDDDDDDDAGSSTHGDAGRSTRELAALRRPAAELEELLAQYAPMLLIAPREMLRDRERVLDAVRRSDGPHVFCLLQVGLRPLAVD